MILSSKTWSTGNQDEALLFLHGMGGTGGLYRPITAMLEMDFRCIALDQRGHGESQQTPNHQFDVKSYAQDVWDTLDDLKIEHAILIGHSMGVRTALQAMALQPGRTRGLIGVDLSLTPSFGGGLGAPFLNFIRSLPSTFASRPELAEYLRLHCPDPSIAAYLRAAAKGPVHGPGEITFPFSSDALRETLKQADQMPVAEWLTIGRTHKIPMLFLRGARSLIWTDGAYAEQKAEFESPPIIQFESWDGASHGLPFEKKTDFVARIRAFSSELSGAESAE
jgi:pimeloyl-ACP methyl ester carboxylesterase